MTESKEEYAARMARREAAIKAADVVLEFRGSMVRRCDGPSKVIGSYPTVANGWGERFEMTSRRSGETLEHDGKVAVVLYHGYLPGSPYTFAKHTLCLAYVD